MKNILLASLLVASPAAFAASFDCQKASTEIEHKICDNERLSKLDEQLSSTYSIALKANPGDADTLKTVQRQWINMRGKLTDDKALELAYLIQINGLKGLGGSASTSLANETPKQVQKQPEVREKTDTKPVKSGNELTLESFRAKYIEVDGEYYSTTSLPRGSSFLFTCASRMADDRKCLEEARCKKRARSTFSLSLRIVYIPRF